MNKPDLTAVSSEDLLAELGRREREPYIKVSKACASIYAWLDAITENHLEPDPDRAWRDEQLHAIAVLWDEYKSTVVLAAGKSALLNRLLYADGELRPFECPTHKGHWWGCPWPGDQDCDCIDECGNGTGWIK